MLNQVKCEATVKEHYTFEPLFNFLREQDFPHAQNRVIGLSNHGKISHEIIWNSRYETPK
jgi:hypothetical protein